MRPLLILADDLTGAADTAARCQGSGVPAALWLRPPHLPLAAGATAFTSDSRHLCAQQAAARVRDVASPLRSTDARWYKKIDSTLRGNIGAEVDALLDLRDADCAVVCSAFPAQGRTLRQGFLQAPGVAAQTVHLPTLLRAQSNHEVVHVPLASVRAGALGTELRRGRGRQRILFAVDAVRDEDFKHLLDAVNEAIPDALLCGSAGLVGALAAGMAQEAAGQTQKAVTSIPPSPARGRQGTRATFVVGSGSAMAHRQVDVLCEKLSDAARLIVAPNATPVPPGAVPDCLLLHQPLPAADAVLDGPAARQRASHLAEQSVAAMRRQHPDLLVLVGGDTAIAVLTALGVEHLVVEQELLPGIPLCRPGGASTEAPAHIILKPGSFGDEHTLVTLLDRSRDLL